MSKISNKTLEVVEDIQKKIINGILNPGDRLLPLRELATEYDTSRSVINSAIHILSTKGYLKINPRHFVEVNDFLYSGSLDIVKDIYFESKDELRVNTIKEVLDIRMFAETDAIRQIIQNNLPFDELKSILEKEKALINTHTSDLDKMVALDCEFHECLVKTSKHSVLFLLYMSFKSIELDLVSKFYDHPNLFKSVVNAHEELISCLESNNLSKAIETWTGLLEQGEQVVLEK